MQIIVHDYDHSALKPRSYSDQTLVFPAWLETEMPGELKEVHVNVADFLEYCRDTNQIHPDADISRHGSGLVRIPVKITGRFDAGRGEYYESEKTFSYTFADFLADFSGTGLTEALTQFLNDSRTNAG